MPRGPLTFRQSDIARAIRAAKQAGADRVEVRVGEQATIVFRLTPSTGPEDALEPDRDIVL